MARARPAKLKKSWVLIPAIAAAGLLIGLCSIRYPELPGNGKSILSISLNSGLTLSAAVVLLFLKPLLTAVFLRAGAVGGMLTPVARDRRSDGICCGVGDQYVDRAPRQRARRITDVRGGRPRDHAAGADMGGDLRLGAGTPAVVAACTVPGRRGRCLISLRLLLERRRDTDADLIN